MHNNNILPPTHPFASQLVTDFLHFIEGIAQIIFYP